MKRIKFQTLAKLGTCMLLILLLVKVFIGEWVYIPSDSMFPTISARSLVWNSKITYGALMPQRIVETPVLNLLCLIPAVAKADKKTNWGYHRVWGYSSPQRMDVVIFKWDENETQLYVKRIIGMPKDTIQLKDGIVYINNKAIEEKGKRIASHDNFGPIVIKEDCYFVMGDFRYNSLDSRQRGLVPLHCISGKAIHKLWNRNSDLSLFEAIEKCNQTSAHVFRSEVQHLVGIFRCC